ncbi:MAG: cadmium-translocating P-type ATPase [Phyllobacteriaceae bacterium]|nr:cadmium-translocating P-type ATPase [Phyllobacteriaceae bacterium]
MSCCASPLVSGNARDALSSSRIALLEDLKANSKQLVDGRITYLLSAPAIHCGNCISTIEGEVGKIEGVTDVRANLTMKRLSVTLDGERRSLLPAISLLESLGYAVQSLTAEESTSGDPEFKSLLRSLAVAGFATANIMLLSVPVWNGADGATRELFHFISALIAIPCVAYGGLPFFRSAFGALRRRRVNMDVPISLGVTLATVMSVYESFIGGGHAYFDAAVSLLFFLLIGRVLDQMMRSRARAAAGNLARLSAKGGFLVGDTGELTYIALDGITPGMRLRISAGERFPVDGTVCEGVSDVDRALVTGESEPQRVANGTSVEAGTLNLTGSVDMVASRPARDSFLAEVTQMMAAAEKGRSGYVRLADRMARVYAPVVHVLAFTSFTGWMLWTGGDLHQSLTVAVAVLIITCPCALGLAVPVAHVVSAARLFSAGILLKDGSALERLEAIDGAVFDKTGTLTTGEPAVTVSTIPAGDISSVAKALALRSVHPAARALARHIAEAPETRIQDLHEVPGHGVEAVVAGRRARLGRGSWVAEIAPAAKPDSLSGGVVFAIEGEGLWRSQLSERIRPGARDMLDAFRRRNLPVTLLSGDGRAQVAAVAARLGLTDSQSELKPGDKLAFLTDAAAHGRKLLMVGDGLNDAPALAAAHVSMAPASASDIGRTAADFVFTRDSLATVTYAHRVALATGRIVRQNFGLAIVYNIFAVPLAMAGQLNPLIAAIAMSSSSIIVVGNSLRLHLLRPADVRDTTAETDAKPHVARLHPKEAVA